MVLTLRLYFVACTCFYSVRICCNLGSESVVTFIPRNTDVLSFLSDNQPGISGPSLVYSMSTTMVEEPSSLDKLDEVARMTYAPPGPFAPAFARVIAITLPQL